MADETVDPYTALFAFIDEKRGAGSSVSSQAAPLINSNKFTELVKLSVEHLPVLFAEPEKEAEEGLYIVCALVERALAERAKDKDKTATTKLLESVASAITAAAEPHTHLRLRILTTLFNLIPAKHAGRAIVFSTMIRFAAASNNIEAIVPLLPKVDAWFADWGTDAEGRRAVLSTIVDALSKSRKRQAMTHEFLLQYLSHFQGAPDSDLATAEAAAAKAVVQAISVPDIYQFERYTDLDAVRRLSKTGNSKLYDLLIIFASKSLPEFTEFEKTNAAVLTQHGLERDACVHKMRLLSLCTLASSRSEISFAEAAQCLQVAEGEVERWVIRTIAAKLIDARIHQPTCTVHIKTSTVRMFSDVQWGQLHSKLSTWRDGVDSLVQVVRKARAEE